MWSGECFFSALAQANAQTVAEYMADLGGHYASLGYVKLSVFLDRNSTHLVKMRTHYQALSAGQGLQIEFIHFAPYSPALNPVEYLIHWVRQKSLHHANCKQNLGEVKERLMALLNHQKVLSQEQLINILVHIENLIEDKQKSNLSP